MSVQQEANGGEWGQVANGGNIKKMPLIATNGHQWLELELPSKISRNALSNEVD